MEENTGPTGPIDRDSIHDLEKRLERLELKLSALVRLTTRVVEVLSEPYGYTNVGGFAHKINGLNKKK